MNSLLSLQNEVYAANARKVKQTKLSDNKYFKMKGKERHLRDTHM